MFQIKQRNKPVGECRVVHAVIYRREVFVTLQTVLRQKAG